MSWYFCLFIYVTRGSIHIVTVDKTSTIVWQDPWRVFNEDETWSDSHTSSVIVVFASPSQLYSFFVLLHVTTSFLFKKYILQVIVISGTWFWKQHVHKLYLVQISDIL